MTRIAINRRLLGAAAIAAMTLGLAACGKGEETKSGAAPSAQINFAILPA